MYSTVHGSQSYKDTPTWSVSKSGQSMTGAGPSVTGPSPSSDTKSNLAQGVSGTPGPDKVRFGGPVGRMGSRTGGDIVSEQIDAGVKGLAAAVGLGGFLALLGPDGQKLGLDHYGRLVCARDGKLLTGKRGACHSVAALAMFAPVAPRSPASRCCCKF